MRVLLLNPPAERTTFRDGYCSSSSKSGYCWQPLDLLAQSGSLSAAGHTLAFIDAIGARLSPEAALARAVAFAPEVIVGLIGDASLAGDVRFYRRLLRALDRRAAPRLVLSGDVARFEPDRAFREVPGLDAVLVDFATDGVSRWLDGEALPEGLRFPDGRAAPVTGRAWSAPTARHDLLPARGYRLPFHGGLPFASVLASYGCPFRCTFCNTGELGYRVRPVDEALAEFEAVAALGYRRVYLRDATANGHRRSLLELCRALAPTSRRDLGLRWKTFCTVLPFDAELAHAMARAGCAVVQFGIESGSAVHRKRSGKPFDNDVVDAAVRVAREAGLQVCGHFVLGLPGEEADDVRATIDYACALDLDWASFNLAAARPGTILRAEADRQGLPGGDASGDGFVAGLAHVEPQVLRRLKRDALLRFYARPRALRAMLPDLSTRAGWSALTAAGRALVASF